LQRRRKMARTRRVVSHRRTGARSPTRAECSPSSAENAPFRFPIPTLSW
jgi:hypothetical protein